MSSVIEERSSEGNERERTDEEHSTLQAEPPERCAEESSTSIANDTGVRNQSPTYDGAPLTPTSNSVGDRENSFPKEAKDDWSLLSPEEENLKDGGGEEEREGGGGLAGGINKT